MMERLLTVAEVADFCAVSSKTISRAINAGDLRAARLGSRIWRVSESDMHDYIAARTTRVRQPEQPGRPIDLMPLARRGTAVDCPLPLPAKSRCER